LILSAQISFVPGDGAKIKIDMTGDWNVKISRAIFLRFPVAGTN
jgi:hypothetical protein